jgi:hypothetical protein
LADEFGHADACTTRLQFEALVQIILKVDLGTVHGRVEMYVYES